MRVKNECCEIGPRTVTEILNEKQRRKKHFWGVTDVCDGFFEISKVHVGC